MPSLRTHRISLYAFSAAIDAYSMGIPVSTYTRVRSAAGDGMWWASRGVLRSSERAPTTGAQHDSAHVFGLDRGIVSANPSLTSDGVIVDSDGNVHRITGMEGRTTHGDAVQLKTIHVDRADAAFNLVEPD